MWSLYYGQEEWIGRAIGHSKLTIALSYGSHILWRPLSLIFLLIKLPTEKVDGPNTRDEVLLSLDDFSVETESEIIYCKWMKPVIKNPKTNLTKRSTVLSWLEELVNLDWIMEVKTQPYLKYVYMNWKKENKNFFENGIRQMVFSLKFVLWNCNLCYSGLKNLVKHPSHLTLSIQLICI